MLFPTGQASRPVKLLKLDLNGNRLVFTSSFVNALMGQDVKYQKHAFVHVSTKTNLDKLVGTL